MSYHKHPVKVGGCASTISIYTALRLNLSFMFWGWICLSFPCFFWRRF